MIIMSTHIHAHTHSFCSPELALLTHKPRAASAYAVGTVKLAGETFACILCLFVVDRGVLYCTAYMCVLAVII